MLLLFYTPQGLMLGCPNFAHTVHLRIPHASVNIDIISLDSFRWLVILMEVHCVLRKVQTESLSIM